MPRSFPIDVDIASTRLTTSTKGDLNPRSRVSVADFVGAGHPRPQPRRAAARKERDSEATSSNFFRFRLSSVDSLSTFLNHLISFPAVCFSQEYGAAWESIRSVFDRTQNHFIGDGASFSISVTTDRQLDPDLLIIREYPEILHQKHDIVAMKVPKIEQMRQCSQQRFEGVKEDSLGAGAWENHCLFHLPV